MFALSARTWSLIGVALIVVGVLGGTFKLGYTAGAQACETERAESRLEVARSFAIEEKNAAETGIKIRDIGVGLRVALPLLQRRADDTVREVTADVDHAPSLAACVVPDRTRELRRQQVADSAAAAAQHRAMR